MKTEIANKKLEILNLIFKSKDGASWNEVSEMLNEFEKVCKDEAIAEHEAGKTVIKAKALRKKGTDKWYVAYESGKIPNQETLYFNETRSINGAAHNYDFWYKSQNFYPPADAELIDIEIIVKSGGEK